MAKQFRPGNAVRDFILGHVEGHPGDITRLTCDHFGISRQSVVRHLDRLVAEGLLAAAGRTRGRTYSLLLLADEKFLFQDVQGLEEDEVWRLNILPLLADAPRNVIDICHYGVTEMLNNVRDHSESEIASLRLERNASRVELTVIDLGVGVFEKVQRAFGLHDPRHALLELSKGKLTTDPSRHVGESLFFVAQMFDRFSVLSGGLYYSASNESSEGLPEGTGDEVRDLESPSEGTMITMTLGLSSQRTMQSVFETYSSGAMHAQFSRTRVPLRLAQYGEEQLVSRSQAKRVLARFEQFRGVVLDFQGVEAIGPAFADEIFRVFRNANPAIELESFRANPVVKGMIGRARAGVPADDASGETR